MKNYKNDIATAIKIATIAHQGQVDKAGAPYILHPLRVMMMGSTEEEKIVGILHDVIEDGGVSYSALSTIFGAHIADTILSVSRAEGESYREFINRVATDPLAVKVKINDLKDNMDSRRIPVPTSQDLKRTKKYARALKVLEVVDATGTLDTLPLREVA